MGQPMGQPTNSLAQMLAQILGGAAQVMNGVIIVQKQRDLRVAIEGTITRSFLALPFAASFEPADQPSRDYGGDNDRNYLNLGEIVLTENEVDPFVTTLRAGGLEVTALHNHWLYTVPQIWYMHWQKIEPPLDFARHTADALRVINAR